jgi:hypothetical protein
MVTEPPGVEWLDVARFAEGAVVVVGAGGDVAVVTAGAVVEVSWETAVVDVVAGLADGARVELVVNSLEPES